MEVCFRVEMFDVHKIYRMMVVHFLIDINWWRWRWEC